MDRTLMRMRDVRRAVGLSRSEIYRRIAAGEFPSPVPIGDRARAWVTTEIEAWIADRIAARDARAA